ncbi:uncharacterized protein LOC117336849 [Pecten maximus]|uniref:uncharacterized protein LOC117336849 n=1 Tax=Pecten maximus TaxID=6579 RepID=UPI0014580948|nr:uncharacterized protein LOC117336849 [Pecten maximus]
MGKTKTLAKKSGHRCPMCAARFEDMDAWSRHLIECGNRQMSLKKYECPSCDYAAAKKCDLDRHQKRSGHSEPQPNSDSDDDWEEQDQGYILSPQSVKQEPEWSVTLNREEGDFKDEAVGSSFSVAAPCLLPEASQSLDTSIRKRPASMSPVSSKRKVIRPSSDLASVESTENLAQDQYTNYNIITVDVSTQTDAPVKTKMWRKTVKYQKKGKTIEEVTEENWTDY